MNNNISNTDEFISNIAYIWDLFDTDKDEVASKGTIV